MKSDTLLLTNFVGNFETEIHYDKCGTTVSLRFDKLKPKRWNEILQVGDKDLVLERIETFVSDFLTSCIFAEAECRLRRQLLLSSSQKSLLENGDCDSNSGGIHLEHIAATCGYDGGFLQTSREVEYNLLQENGTKMMESMKTKLLKVIPSPDQDFTTRLEEQEEEEKDATITPPTSALEYEVSMFVANYSELLKCSHCVVPSLAGALPSSMVPTTSVSDVALSKFFETQGSRENRLRHMMELDERQRIGRSRDVVAPSVWIVVSFLLVTELLLLSVCWQFNIKCCRAALPPSLVQPTAVVLSVISSFHGLSSLIRVLGSGISDEEKSSFENHWKGASDLVSAIERWYYLWRGWPCPFEQKVLRLNTYCTNQQIVWSRRLATKDYYTYLRRKRVTFGRGEQLLLALGEQLAEKDGRFGTYDFQGELPGTIEEATAFLDLQEDTDCDEDENAPSQSSLEAIAAEVATSLQEFPVGTRVALAETTPFSYDGTAYSSDIDALTIGCHVGTVISSFVSGSGVVLVLFDGRSTAEFVSPSSLRRLLDTSVVEDDDKSPLPEKNMKTTQKEAKNARCVGDSQRKSEVNSSVNDGEFHKETSSEEEEAAAAVETTISEASDDNSVADVEEDDEAKAKDEPPIVTDETNKSRKLRTIREALEEGDWVFHRAKKHILYRRKVAVAKKNTTAKGGE